MLIKTQNADSPGECTTQEWKKFLTRVRARAMPYVSKHFHDPDDQEDVLAELILWFLLKLLQVRGQGTLVTVTPTLSEQNQFLANIKDRVIDIDRRINGRERFPTDVKTKSPLEKEVYKRLFMQKVSAETIVEEMCSDGTIRENEIIAVIEKLEQELGDKARQRAHGSRRESALTVNMDAELFDDREPWPDERIANDELAQRLSDALGKLKPDERLILQFRYVDGLEIKEIAKLLGYKRHQIVYKIILGKNKLLKYFKRCGLALDDFV